MTPTAPFALVVGAAQAAGAAVSNYLAAYGYNVVAVDAGLRPSGYADQVHLDADLAHEAEIKRVVAEARALFGAPSLLVVALPAPAPLPPSQALRTATVGWLDVTQAIAEAMARGGAGQIVFLPPPPIAQTAGQALAAATQRAAAEAFATQFAGLGVRVNTVEVSPQARATAYRDVLGAVTYLDQAKTLWGEVIRPGRLAA